MIYKLFYKCRRCGKTEPQGTVPNFLHVADIFRGTSKEFFLIDFHICDDRNTGITDFIGAENYPIITKEQDHAE